MRERRAAIWTVGGFSLAVAIAMAARAELPRVAVVHWLMMLGLALVFVGLLGLTLARERDTGTVVFGMAAAVIGLGLLAWPATGVLRGVALGAAVGVLGVLPRCLRDAARAPAARQASMLEEGPARGGRR